MARVKPEELVMDYALYPRVEIDSANTADILRAMKAGVKMPPVVVEKSTMRVVDGFHRTRAALKIKARWINVEYRSYESEAEVYLDAVQLNAAHGKRLSHYDQARIIAKAGELSVDPEIVAAAMNVSVERISHLKLTKMAVGPLQTIVPIKNTIRHMAGKKLTAQQVEVNEGLGGMPPRFYVNELIRLMHADLIDLENESLVNALQELARAVEAKFAVPV